MLTLSKNSKVYIACPYGSKTGGPEALHQLHFKLRKQGIQSFLCAPELSGKREKTFEKYNPTWIPVPLWEDIENNIVVLPEGLSPETNLFFSNTRMQKVFWWLSVDNYFSFENHIPVENLFGYDFVHCTQSEYASQFLLQQGLHQFYPLTDYINKEFLDKSRNVSVNTKEDIVLYNPSKLNANKGNVILDELIEKFPSIHWIALKNLTNEQLIDLYRKSKIYLDLGSHPGRDRIPREAALFKCITLFGLSGSAKYFLDVPVSMDYKFNLDDPSCSENLIKMIHHCFENYTSVIRHFEFYVRTIKQQERVFEVEIQRLFGE